MKSLKRMQLNERSQLNENTKTEATLMTYAIFFLGMLIGFFLALLIIGLCHTASGESDLPSNENGGQP